MASLNGRGQILLGRGLISVDNMPYLHGAALGWLTDDLILYGGTGDLTMRTCNVQNGEVVELPEGQGLGFDVGVACGGSWAARVGVDGHALMYGTLGTVPEASPYAAGRDGTLGIVRTGIGNLMLVDPAGREYVAAGPSEAVYTPHVLGPQSCVWNGDRGAVRVTPGLPLPVLPPGGGGTIRRLVTSDGMWACHYMGGVGFVAHPWSDPTKGLIAPATVDNMYNTDAIPWQGGILLGGSRGPGELPGEGRTHWFNPADQRIDLTKLTAVPPPPPPPLEDPPVPDTDLDTRVQAALRRVRADRTRYPAPGLRTEEEASRIWTPELTGALLNDVAWAFRGEGVGLEAKSGGNVAIQPRTLRTIGSDILRFPGDIGRDVIAGDLDRTPGWGDAGPADPARFVAPVEPLGLVPVDVPPPVDLPPDASVAHRLSELERLVAELRGMLNDTARELGQAIAALEGPRPMAIKSSRGRYLRDAWEDSIGHFDRTDAADGEIYTLEPK